MVEDVSLANELAVWFFLLVLTTGAIVLGFAIDSIWSRLFRRRR